MERSGNDMDREMLEFLERRKRRQQRRQRRLIMSVAVTLLALVLFGLTAYITYERGMRSLESSRLRAMQHAARSGGATQGEPVVGGVPVVAGWINVLVIGTDQDTDRAGRTDTIMLVGFNPRTGDAGVLSIPRDTRVEIPGQQGFHRINVAYAMGGPRLLMRTVEELLGVDVHHYVTINFSGFERFIDALGGVEVEIPRPMRYDDFAQGLHIDLPAGRQVLNGRQALHYVRYRADGLGDVSLVDPAREVYDGRVRRQLEFAELVARKVLSFSSLPRLPQLVQEFFGMVRTDISLDRALALAVSARNLNSARIRTAVLPGTSATIGGASYWMHDRGRTRLVVDRVIRGLEPATVEVLNGSGQSGAATRAADYLRRSGFEVVRIGNAGGGFTYDRTQVVVHRAGIDVDGLAAAVGAWVEGGRVVVEGPPPQVLRDSAFVGTEASSADGSRDGAANRTGGANTASAAQGAGGGVASGPHATVIIGRDFQG